MRELTAALAIGMVLGHAQALEHAKHAQAYEHTQARKRFRLFSVLLATIRDVQI